MEGGLSHRIESGSERPGAFAFWYFMNLLSQGHANSINIRTRILKDQWTRLKKQNSNTLAS